MWQWCINQALIFWAIHADKHRLDWCRPLGGTGLLIWSAALRETEKHNHLPATYIYMSNSTGVPSLWVKQLESAEQHFPPTELEFQCVRYIKQPLFSKMMKYRFNTNTNRICLMYSALYFSMHDWKISVCSVSALKYWPFQYWDFSIKKKPPVRLFL